MTTRIVTHDGLFHADEVAAVAIVAMAAQNIQVTRTRDRSIINAALLSSDVVFDIGGVYDKPMSNFDHHQHGGAGTRENGIEYASAGLAWLTFGLEVLCSMTSAMNVDIKLSEAHDIIKLFDARIIQAIDLNDNGVGRKEPSGLSMIISSYNPTWLDETTKEDEDRRFMEAVELAKAYFTNILRTLIGNALAKSIVDSAIASASPNIMVLEKYVPWIEHVLTNDSDNAKNLKFVIFPSTDGEWRIQAIPEQTIDGTRKNRMNLPVTWRALSGEALVDVTKVEDAVFCHRAGFIAGAKSINGILALAGLALP